MPSRLVLALPGESREQPREHRGSGPSGSADALGRLVAHGEEVRRLSLDRWSFFLPGLGGASSATRRREDADKPAGDGGKDRRERVRHRDPVVDEHRPGDPTDDEVQAKSRHDRDIQPVGKGTRTPLELHLHYLLVPGAPIVILL
jgi:hypothetical protein